MILKEYTKEIIRRIDNIKIINNTDLSYKIIGEIIDSIKNKDIGGTHYYGQIEWCVVEIASKKVKVQIRYLKRYVEWRFDYE